MLERLDELIQKEMVRSTLPGVSIALVKGEEIVWSRGYGYADLETERPVTPSTVFSIQSVTKPVVTTALMQWHERGRFALDDAVNDHAAPVRIQNEWEKTNPVTIRQLLTHTSGLPVDLELGAPAPGDPASLEEYLTGVAKTVRPPGEEMIYANWGYDIVGYLVGRWAGTSYGEYLAEHVFDPLEMRSSTIGLPEDTDTATGYFLSVLDDRHFAGQGESLDTVPPRPCGAMYSTVEDLGRFLIAHLNGGKYRGTSVLKKESVAEMHRLHARSGASPNGMGLGFRVIAEKGRRLVCHGGDGTHFTAFLGGYPDQRVGAAILINMGRAQTARSVIARAALRTLLDEERTFHPVKSAAPVADEGWERAAGSYVSSFWGIDATLTVDEGRPSVNLEGGLVAGENGERSYLWRNVDGTVCGYDGPFDGFEVAFEYEPDGSVTRFYGGLYPFRFDRVGKATPAGDIDEEAELAGRWVGTVRSPLGPVPVEMNVADGGHSTATALAAQNEAVRGFSAAGGRLTGYFDTSLGALGELRIFLRLGAVQGKLAGRVYARGSFGEVPMKAELTRQ